MEFRPLHLTIHNAKDLKTVTPFSKMDPYVIVTISNDQCTMQKTPVHNNGGTNPSWEFPMHFNVDENSLMQNNAALHFNIKEYGKLGDKDIGQVIVPLKELFDSKADNVNKDVSYGVRTMSEKAEGMLNFSFKFGDKFSASDKAVAGAYPPHANTHAEASKSGQLVMAYPPGPPARGVYSGYHAQQAGYSHPPPGPGGPYGYQPPPPGPGGPYGYQPPPPGPGGPYGYQPLPPGPGAPYGYQPPPPGPGGPYGYQPPPPMQSYQQLGYGYPPRQYGYLGQQPGYGHPGGKVRPQKSGGFRLGLRLGVGLLSGMLLGEAGDFGGLDDAAAYADGYFDASDFGGLDDAAAYGDGYW